MNAMAMSDSSNQILRTIFTLQEQILLIDGDMFTTEPVKTLNEVEDFLGVKRFFSDSLFDFSGKKGFPCFKLNNDSKCMSSEQGRDHPPIGSESLSYLRKYYRPILNNFEGQTGMELTLS